MCWTVLLFTELDGSELPFDRRRMLETALTESLTFELVNKQRLREKHQLTHFSSVKTEVRFLNLDKTDQTEMELFCIGSESGFTGRCQCGILRT